VTAGGSITDARAAPVSADTMRAGRARSRARRPVSPGKADMPPCVIAVVCLALAAETPAARKPPAPLYTNDDLERVSPRRGETGVLSSAPPDAALVAPAKPVREARGEAYWRQEADRLRERLAPLRERAEDLRLQLEELDRRPPARTRSGSAGRADEVRKETIRARLAAAERRIREMEDVFLDRARREGALPGWLR
jgi:hypothetical protein